MPRRATDNTTAHAFRRRSRDVKHRGAIMIVMMLALIVLAGLIAYVLNIGRHVNTKIVTQHAADSSASAGAAWVARSLNTVAMNNIAQSRYVALVPVLDGLPLATESALHEQTAFFNAITVRNREGFSTGSSRLDQAARREFALLADQLDGEVQLLEPVHEFFTANDVRELTFYNGPSGTGSLWQAMQTLDQVSQAAVTSLGVLAQVNTGQAARINFDGTGTRLLFDGSGGTSSTAGPEGSSLLVPVLPELPIRRGAFGDFHDPVLKGIVSAEIDNDTTRRGPFDALFGWRGYIRRADPNAPSGSTDTAGVDRGDNPSPFGGGPSDQGQPGAYIYDGYVPYGMYRHILDRVNNIVSRDELPNLEHSRFATWTAQLANTKISYLWSDWGYAARSQFARPKWNLEYPGIIEQPPEPLHFSETGYFRLDIKSRYPRTHSQFMADEGSYWYEGTSRYRSQNNPDRSKARVIRRRGWWLPLVYNAAAGQSYYLRYPHQLNAIYAGISVTKIGEYAWIYEYEYTVYEDVEIGLPRVTDAGGNSIAHTAYFIQIVLYAGVNDNPIAAGTFDPDSLSHSGHPTIAPALGDDWLTPEVRSPYNGFNPNSAQAPAPIDFIHQNIPPQDELAQRKYLSFLAIAAKPDRPLVWDRKFAGGKVVNQIVSVTQADVFNNHSWDLWTQMWHSQIVKVDNYTGWRDTLAQTPAAAVSETGVSSELVTDLTQYLRATEPLAQPMLTH